MNIRLNIGGGYSPSHHQKGGKALTCSPRLPKGGQRRNTFCLLDGRCE